jgi:hypothetical protein
MGLRVNIEINLKNGNGCPYEFSDYLNDTLAHPLAFLALRQHFTLTPQYSFGLNLALARPFLT